MDFYDIDIKKIDSQNMASQIASLYTQISDSISISDSFFNNDNRYKNIIKDYDNIFVFVGDCPFVGKNNIRKMLDNHIETQSDLTIISSLFKEKKFPYARIIRSLDGHIIKCIEEINANEEQKKKSQNLEKT